MKTSQSNRNLLLGALVFLGTGIAIGLYLADTKDGLPVIPSAQAQEAAKKEEPLISPTKARERDAYYPNSEDLGADEMRIIACGTGIAHDPLRPGRRLLSRRTRQR